VRVGDSKQWNECKLCFPGRRQSSTVPLLRTFHCYAAQSDHVHVVIPTTGEKTVSLQVADVVVSDGSCLQGGCTTDLASIETNYKGNFALALSNAADQTATDELDEPDGGGADVALDGLASTASVTADATDPFWRLRVITGWQYGSISVKPQLATQLVGTVRVQAPSASVAAVGSLDDIQVSVCGDFTAASCVPCTHPPVVSLKANGWVHAQCNRSGVSVLVSLTGIDKVLALAQVEVYEQLLPPPCGATCDPVGFRKKVTQPENCEATTCTTDECCDRTITKCVAVSCPANSSLRSNAPINCTGSQTDCQTACCEITPPVTCTSSACQGDGWTIDAAKDGVYDCSTFDFVCPQNNSFCCVSTLTNLSASFSVSPPVSPITSSVSASFPVPTPTPTLKLTPTPTPTPTPQSSSTSTSPAVVASVSTSPSDLGARVTDGNVDASEDGTLASAILYAVLALGLVAVVTIVIARQRRRHMLRVNESSRKGATTSNAAHRGGSVACS
jgi:hypothetical protein